MFAQVDSPDYIAAVVIGADGDERLVLAERAAIGDPDVGCSRDSADTAPHEQLGTLPTHWRSRVALAPLRCGRRTRSGGRCPAYVGRPGDACAWRREKTEL